MKEYVSRLLRGRSFDIDDATKAMNRILSHKATPTQLGAFLMAMNLKGVTPEELAGFSTALGERSLNVPEQTGAVDITGTGGDGHGTFNVSTTASLIVAAAGVRVAKQVNRAVSSQCGSGNVLHAIGIQIDGGPQTLADTIDRFGIGVMFAPLFHPTLTHYDMPRYELGFFTIFDMMMPLVNPAKVRRLVIGVNSREHIGTMAEAAEKLGIERALVVSSSAGIDEFSVVGINHVVEVRDGTMEEYELSAKDVGLPKGSLDDVKGGDVDTNAMILVDVCRGRAGAYPDTAVFNAGAGLYVAGRVDSIRDGVDLAREIVSSGKADDLLQAWQDYSQAKSGT